MSRVITAVSLTPEERIFAIALDETGNPLEAYQIAFPERAESMKPTELRAEGRKLSQKPAVERFLRWLDSVEGDPIKIAEGIASESMLVGGSTDRLRAAQAVLKRDEKANARKAIDRWKTLLMDVGAEIRAPVTRADARRGFIDVDLGDVVRGDAQVRLGTKSEDRAVSPGRRPVE